MMNAAVIAGEVVALVVAIGAMLLLGWYDSVHPSRAGAGAKVISRGCLVVAFAAMAAMVLLAVTAAPTA